jgi:hypothetical protein
MTFRVEDLTVTLLPERYDIEDAACTKCTKCTARTGDPTSCSDPSEAGCECCQKASNPTKKTKSSAAEQDLAELRAQLDQFLASLNK